jgi:hypothetical protein
MLTIILGIFLMLVALFSTGRRAAFSRGPWLPMTNTTRLILLVGGLLACAIGLRSVLK